MATRKQRRRRQKEFRHEYVWEDERGNPIDVQELRSERVEKGARAQGGSSPRGGRTVQPPSWHRTFRRSLIFAPIFLLMVLLLNGGRGGLAYALFNTVLLLAIFIPFSYLMDKLLWRSFQKRQAKARG
jgi:hypothetical protein